MISAPDILNARIQVVDDLEANGLLLEQMLRGAGYAPIAATMDPHAIYELHRKHRDRSPLALKAETVQGAIISGSDGYETPGAGQWHLAGPTNIMS